ncbi:formate/nitrate transporter [Streptococcus pneumoniae]|nr:formate/nitrate transporter [Streptococcus pneumoniae]
MVSSEFISKIEFACNKKESLYSQSKFKYAIRSMFAGAFLTFSTAAGAVGADLINKIAPGSGRFLFPFVFAWGLAYIVFLNAELVTSNMMFLTAGSFLKKISWRKTAEILLYCTLFNLIGALIAGWGFAHSAAYANLTHDSFISGVVEMKLGRSNELVLLEAILALSPSVADHPLRSAMYRRLGEPLPHQLANTTQVHLVVMQVHLLSKCHATSTLMRY